MDTFTLGGLIAATYTPFDVRGDLKLAVVERQAAALAAVGVPGAFVCGTTGEGLSLTTAERMQVAQRWVDVCRGGPLKVIVHVGHNSQRDALALAAHARQIGAAAVAALSPFFFKPSTVAQLVDFLQPIALAADPLPFYYYHIPSMTGVAFPMVDLIEAVADRIPNLRGIKFTHSDLMDFQRCLHAAAGAYDMAWGLDEMLLGALAVGARCAVGSTYNYAAPLYTRMIAAYHRGEMSEAQACAARSTQLVAILLRHGVLRAGKATMAMLGIDCGPPRAPLTRLTDEELSILRASYERIGFFDWAGG